MSTPMSSMISKPRVGVADALADVGVLLGHERLGLGVEKWSSGTVDGSRCGAAISAARGTATWACMSTVMLFGRVSRPGLPRLRAAVGSYLFHMSAIAAFDSSAVVWTAVQT